MGDSVFIPPGYEMLSGSGAPASTLGMDTDRYLDELNKAFYVKSNGAWTKTVDFASGGSGLQLLGTATLGETTLVSIALGVKRYPATMSGALTSDRLIVALTGAPINGTVQDAYVSAANTVSVGVLVPALGIGATISVPVAVYKVV